MSTHYELFGTDALDTVLFCDGWKDFPKSVVANPHPSRATEFLRKSKKFRLRSIFIGCAKRFSFFPLFMIWNGIFENSGKIRGRYRKLASTCHFIRAEFPKSNINHFVTIIERFLCEYNSTQSNLLLMCELSHGIIHLVVFESRLFRFNSFWNLIKRIKFSAGYTLCSCT